MVRGWWCVASCKSEPPSQLRTTLWQTFGERWFGIARNAAPSIKGRCWNNDLWITPNEWIVMILFSVCVCVCVTFVWLQIGDWGGLIDAGGPQSGNLFRFRFVFVSCVRASGRGEAVWACEWGVIVNDGGLHSNISCSGRAVVFCVFVAMLVGFKTFWDFWVLRSLVFLIWFRFCCYAHGFFDVFVQLVRFRCNAHDFF
jgi:hypothetical protein